MSTKGLRPSDFDYELQEQNIAQHPLEPRDSSKLLYYNHGTMSHHIFREIPEIIPGDAMLIFNNTKVFPARTFFKRESGAIIQIFLLEPTKLDVQEAMATSVPILWNCMIGNLKKWKDGEKLETIVRMDDEDVIVEATLVDRKDRVVDIRWSSDHIFSEVVHALGKIPLPPYIRRDVEDEDQWQYQTIYAKEDGAVAAPTAGLHFTQDVLQKLRNKGIDIEEVTLHVGAGTFQPLQAENVIDHDMHSEQFMVSRNFLEKLKQNPKRFAVGTTSLRTLESLYWCGVKASKDEDPTYIEKLYPYENPSEISYEKAIQSLLDCLEGDVFKARTAIMIMPGYRIRSISGGGLITNFHLPQSTLIMLVSALIGDDWKKVYESALENNYRFLSYGDSSLLIP